MRSEPAGELDAAIVNRSAIFEGTGMSLSQQMVALVIALIVCQIFYVVARAFGCTVNLLVDRWIKSPRIKAMLGVVPEHILTGQQAPDDQPKLLADPKDRQQNQDGR